ncbi:MAG: glycosyltransferase family 4 protein [Acidimicrobiales bacterium]
MRMTLVNQFYAPDISPTAQLAASLAEHRAALGDDVTVITGRAGYLEGLARTEPSSPRPAVRVRRVWTPDVGKSALWRRLLGYLTFLIGATTRLILLGRQDVIVSMTTPPFLVTGAVLHKLLRRDTRVVLWSMDCYPDAAERLGELRPGGIASRAQRRLNRWVFAHIDDVVVLDGAMRELLERQYAAGPGKPVFSVIPNWERLEAFPTAAELPPWSGYADLPINGRKVVLYLGNTGVGHRFDTVLDAAVKLSDEAVFLFVGGGARTGSLVDAVAHRGLTNVLMHGYVRKDITPAVMAGADAALITLDDRSLGVMSPSKLHATLAAGLPILYVGPEGSNVDEAISQFACGTSLRNGDTDGLASSVRSLHNDPTAHERSRQAFELHYSDHATLPQWDRVLDS